MGTSSDIIFYRHSPENMSEDILRKLFVGREKQLKDLVKEIGNAAKNKTPRFYLVAGPRGIGKSHFLTLLYYEIKRKYPSLLIPVKLAEEEYSVYRASDLFLRILEEYLVEYPEVNSQEIYDILSLEQEDEILYAAVEKLKQISRQDGKRFIIFAENLHELFKQLEKEELQKLRSIFQKNDIFSVVATAPLIFTSLSRHDEPFYNFFNIQYLKEFTYHEIKELMQKIAETENGEEFFEKFGQYEEKIYGMVHLTGGSPRLVFLFYDMIIGGEIENVENAFFKIIDEHTPFYKEIFQMLTGQQRRIFDILISFGETATPKQISEKARIKLQTVNTQLRRLETNGYVISRPMGRHTKYEVRERLFRLWRETRQPFGRKRVSTILDFLQLWYTADERKELFKTKFELLEAGEKSVLRELCYYAEIQPPEFKTEAAPEIKKIYDKIGDIKPELIEYFVEFCLNLALEELKDGNRGNAEKFITMAFKNSSKLEIGIVKELTINFLKAAVESGEMHVIKVAAEEILDQQKDELTGLLRPITKAIEIIETRDLNKYYDLQIEEREIVVDVVRKITKSDELVPDSSYIRNSRKVIVE